MKRLKPTLAIAAVVIIGLVWFLWPNHDEDSSSPIPAIVSTASIAPAQSKIDNQKSKIPPPETAEISHLADQLNSPAGDIRADLRIVSDLLENFRTNFPHDGNPVGTNAEITAALAGKNKLRYAALPPNHPAINRDGELCDRWGTPFFFHAESGSRMTVRSAGPDKKMWTPDDLELAP